MVKNVRNYYVSCLKDVLKNFLNTCKECEKEMKSNAERFTADYLDKANESVIEKKNKAYNRAKELFAEYYEEIKLYLSISSFPKADELTPDRLLFAKGSFVSLSPADVMAYIQKYQKNETMLGFIKNWINENYEGINAYGSCLENIHLSDEKMKTYTTIFKEGLSLVDTIFNGATGMESMTNAFMDEDFSRLLYDIIGDGDIKDGVQLSQMPEASRHKFDSYSLGIVTNELPEIKYNKVW